MFSLEAGLFSFSFFFFFLIFVSIEFTERVEQVWGRGRDALLTDATHHMPCQPKMCMQVGGRAEGERETQVRQAGRRKRAGHRRQRHAVAARGIEVGRQAVRLRWVAWQA